MIGEQTFIKATSKNFLTFNADSLFAMSHFAGIYLLVSEGELVYIGMSKTSIKNRLKMHYKEKIFDRYFFIVMEEWPNEIERLEKDLIQKYNPTYNIQCKTLY